MRIEKSRKKNEDIQKLWKNQQAWNKLKERDPGYAWNLLKSLADVEDWPDWDSDLNDCQEPSLEDQPSKLREKWLESKGDEALQAK